MTPKARDLQEPGQHDMIGALRDALRQYNSEELNPRMREALKSFREGLHAHPYVRSLEKHGAITRSLRRRRFAPGIPRIGLFWRALRPKPLLVGAAVVLVALLVSVLLLAPRPSSDFAWADVVEAMQRVEKAHITGSSGDMWYLRGHGWRWQTVGWEHAPSGRTLILTPEASWLVSEDHATLADPDPALIASKVRANLTAPDWMALMEGPSTEGENRITNWRVNDDVLDGMPVKRLDLWGGMTPDSKGKVWIDWDTKRILRYETWKIEEDGRETLIIWWTVDYDSPVDPSLFAYEPPAGMRIQDSRLTAIRRQAIEGAIAALADYPDEVAYLEHLLAEWLSLNCFFEVVETEDSGHKLARVWSAHFSEEQKVRFESEPTSQFFTFDLNEKKLVEREVKHRLSLPCPSSCRIPGTHTHPSHEQQTLEHVRIEYDEVGQPHILDLKAIE